MLNIIENTEPPLESISSLDRRNGRSQLTVAVTGVTVAVTGVTVAVAVGMTMGMALFVLVLVSVFVGVLFSSNFVNVSVDVLVKSEMYTNGSLLCV